jgi:hypothetical protein
MGERIENRFNSQGEWEKEILPSPPLILPVEFSFF